MLTTRITAALADQDWSVHEIGVLERVSRLGAMTPSRLATILQVDPATVSRAIGRLRDAELIRVDPNPEDRRSRLIALTDKGRTEFEDHLGPLMHAAVLEEMKAVDEDDLEQILRLFRSIAEKLGVEVSDEDDVPI